MLIPDFNSDSTSDKKKLKRSNKDNKSRQASMSSKIKQALSSKTVKSSNIFLNTRNGSSIHLIKTQPIDLPELQPEHSLVEENFKLRNSKKAFLFIPGFWTSAASFLPCMRLLAKKGFTCYSYSQAGQGKSRSKTEPQLSNYIQNLHDISLYLKENQKIQELNVIAYSFGGYLLQRYLVSSDYQNYFSNINFIGSVTNQGMWPINKHILKQVPLLFLKASLFKDMSQLIQNDNFIENFLNLSAESRAAKYIRSIEESYKLNLDGFKKIKFLELRKNKLKVKVVHLSDDKIITSQLSEEFAKELKGSFHTISGSHVWVGDKKTCKEFVDLILDPNS